jgi:hypothetical protein
MILAQLQTRAPLSGMDAATFRRCYIGWPGLVHVWFACPSCAHYNQSEAWCGTWPQLPGRDALPQLSSPLLADENLILPPLPSLPPPSRNLEWRSLSSQEGPTTESASTNPHARFLLMSTTARAYWPSDPTRNELPKGAKEGRWQTKMGLGAGGDPERPPRGGYGPG